LFASILLSGLIASVISAGVYWRLNHASREVWKEEDFQKTSDDDAFLVVFRRDILPQSADINALRLGVLEKAKKSIFPWLWLVFFCPILLGSYLGLFLGAAAFSLSFVLYCLYAMTSLGYDEYKAHYKKNVVERLLQSIDGSLFYRPESSISEDNVKKSNIFTDIYPSYENREPRFTIKLSGEDCFFGSIGKTVFSFSEIYLSLEKVTLRNQRSIKDHHGIFFVVDFNKHTSAVTVGMSSGQEHKMKNTNATLVELEDPVFNDVFDVYSTDQIEARYILTPAFMKSCLDFQQLTGYQISFSLVSGQLFLFIDTQYNFFEPELLGNPVSYTEVKLCFDMIQLIHKMVDVLSLNTRIWTKT